MGEKVEIVVPENVFKFLEALSAFSGKPVKELLEEQLHACFKASLDGNLCNFNITADDLKEKYDLTPIFAPEDED